MTSLHVICGLGPPPIKNPGYAYGHGRPIFQNQMSCFCFYNLLKRKTDVTFINPTLGETQRTEYDQHKLKTPMNYQRATRFMPYDAAQIRPSHVNQ